MKIPLVDLKAQYISMKSEIDQAIADVILESAFIKGKYLTTFEQEFAAYCNQNFCVGVGNGTDALFLILKSLGITHGDEVITPANTFIATSEAISATGAKPVFVDCHPDYYTIDVSRIEEEISKYTKAIIPVHLYGQMADMIGIIELANRHGLLVIEDAAQAHGAAQNGKKAGSMGSAAFFSFYPGKNLGAYGDGGAIVTDNEDLAMKIRMLANHGRVEKYNHLFEGYNSRLDGLQASILSAKLKHLDIWNARRRKISRIYTKLLQEIEVVTPKEFPGNLNVYHQYVIRTKKRDELQAFLEDREIATGIHYPIALPNLVAYEYLAHRKDDFPVSSRYQNEILSLPMYPELDEEKITYIAQTITDFFHH